MTKKREFNNLFESLSNSKNEEEVYQTLKRILKESSSLLYKDKILENPYFRSLIPEVREDVLFDINLIKETINEEIQAIDEELIKSLKDDRISDQRKLKELKRECIALLYEVDERRKDIINLI